MNGKLQGKVVLVTGASKGIGQGLAVGFAEAGASVAVNYKTDADGARTTCERITSAGGSALAAQADIGSRRDFERLIDQVCHHFGRIDVLVNNAARTRFGPFLEINEEDFDDVVNTNLRGPFFGIAAAVRKMLDQGTGGSIINISSCAAELMVMHHSSYTMAKGGLEALTRQLAYELAPHQIRVNAIAPAPTSSARNQAYDPKYDQRWGAVIPAGRIGRVEDYVGPCVFLAGDDSAFLTGETLHVDGGWTLKGHTPDLSGYDYTTDRLRG